MNTTITLSQGILIFALVLLVVCFAIYTSLIKTEKAVAKRRNYRKASTTYAMVSIITLFTTVTVTVMFVIAKCVMNFGG